MAVISNVARLAAGVIRNIDLSASGNALHVDSLQVGSTSPETLTKAILANLISLQNGSDFASGTNAHTHDGRYYTETELTSRSATPGDSLIAVERKTYAYITGYTGLLTDTLANYNVQALLDAINTSLSTAGGTEFLDTEFRINDDGDPTKQIAFQASGVAAGTTRTITMPNADVNLADANNAILKDGTRAFTADQSMGGNKLTSLADPTTAQDAATKSYVDANAAGMKPKEAVRTASDTNINIASGLEAGDTVGGVVLVAGDRVLLFGQTLPENNGIYVASASGAASRSTDFDSLTPIDEINKSWVAVQAGTFAGKTYVQYGTVATIGTDPITFTFYDPLASLVGGDMITNSGSTFSVDLATVSGLESTNPGNVGGQLRTKLEASNPTLRITGSNELAAKLDASGAVVTGANGLAVATDDSTIEKNANALRVKDAGISAAKLATDSVQTAKIVDDAVTAAKINSDVAGTGLAQAADGSLQARGTYLPLTNGNGSTLAAGTAVYLTGSASTFDAADSDAEATCNTTIGVLFASTLTTATGLVQTNGRATVIKEGGGSLSIGGRVYIAGTAGQVTQTAPSASGKVVFCLGIAVSNTEIVLQPQLVAVID